MARLRYTKFDDGVTHKPLDEQKALKYVPFEPDQQLFSDEDIARLPARRRAYRKEWEAALARGLARMGAAGQRLRASLLTLGEEYDPLEQTPYPKMPELAAATKRRAQELSESADFLWRIAQSSHLAAQNKDLLSKTLNLIGETLPYIMATTGAFIATGPGGAFAVGSLVEGHSAYMTALDAGVDEEKAKAIGVAVGIFSGAIESFGGVATEKLMMKASSRIQNSIIRNGAQFVLGAVNEAFEEGGQEIAQIVGEEFYRSHDWDETFQRVIGAMAGGAALGGIFKSISTAGRGIFAEAEQIRQAEGEQAAKEFMQEEIDRLVVSRVRPVAISMEGMRAEPRMTAVQQEQRARMFTILDREVSPEARGEYKSRGFLTQAEYDALAPSFKERLAKIGNPEIVMFPPEEPKAPRAAAALLTDHGTRKNPMEIPWSDLEVTSLAASLGLEVEPGMSKKAIVEHGWDVVLEQIRPAKVKDIYEKAAAMSPFGAPVDPESKNVHFIMRNEVEDLLANPPKEWLTDDGFLPLDTSDQPKFKEEVYKRMEAQGVPKEFIDEAWADFSKPIGIAFEPDIQEAKDMRDMLKLADLTKEEIVGEEPNPYLTMPLERVQEDAENGVRLAQDALRDLGALPEQKPLEENPELLAAIHHHRVRQGLDEAALNRLIEYETGKKELADLTVEEGEAVLADISNLDYMSYEKVKKILDPDSVLIDLGLTPKGIRRLYRQAGSIAAFNRVIHYSQRLGGAPMNENIPDIDGRRKHWERELRSVARKAKRQVKAEAREKRPGVIGRLGYYQSISHVLDRVEARIGVPLRRQWSDIVAEIKGWNWKNEKLVWDAVKRSGVHRAGLLTNPVENRKIALWLDETDAATRANIFSDMKQKTRRLATEMEKILQTEGAHAVRWARFVKWNHYARKAEEYLNRLRAKGKTPTKKQIKKAQSWTKKHQPKNAPASALAEGRAAMEAGVFHEWLDTQEWGTRKRYFMHAAERDGLLDVLKEGEAIEGTIAEEIFQTETKAGSLALDAPIETETRKGGSEVVETENVALAVLRHLDRITAFASTYEMRHRFWESFNEGKPNNKDKGAIRDALKIVRGVHKRPEPWVTDVRAVNRQFWRGYLVYNPMGSAWFASRQLWQNIAFGPSRLSIPEAAKSLARLKTFRGAKAWMKNNPHAEESFKEFFTKHVAEGRAFYRYFIMKEPGMGGLPGMTEKAGKLGMPLSKAGTIADSLAVTPALTDYMNRMAIWPIAYDIAERNLKQFSDGRLSFKQLWSRLNLDTDLSGIQLELNKLLDEGNLPEFMNRYAEYKVETMHFRYSPELRSLAEMTPGGRVALGLVTFPRGVINIAWKNGVEPLMSTNPTKMWAGAKTLIKLYGIIPIFGSAAGLLAAHLWDDDDETRQMVEKALDYTKYGGGMAGAREISKKVTGYPSYGPLDTAIGVSVLNPGAAKIYETSKQASFIIRQGEKRGWSSAEIAKRVAQETSGQVEIMIPMAEVMVTLYENQKDVEGARLWSMIEEEAKGIDNWRPPFRHRRRETAEKIRHLLFGKEMPQPTDPWDRR